MLSLESLQPADILLSTGSAAASVVIRGATVSRYSHAALYLGDGQIIAAIGHGVTGQGIRDAMSDDTLVSVYQRLRMSLEQSQQVVRYARRQVGKDHDYAGAAGGGITSPSGFVIGVFLSPIVAVGAIAADRYNRANPEGSFYCSELVALACNSAGVPLGSGAASTTPADISHSQVLNCVGDLKST